MTLQLSSCRRLVLSLTAVVCLPVAPGQAQDKAAGPARWEKAIVAFEQQDRENPPPKDGILFVGSSSIGQWDLVKSFPGLPVINRGFGGSQISDSVHFAPRIVTKHRPRVVVFYAGDNDIAAGKTPEQVAADFQAFVKLVHQELPKTRVVFLAVKPSLARWKLHEKQKQANALVEAYCQKDERLRYVDLIKPMLGDDGTPRPELFVKDGLHLSAKGYEVWTAAVKPHLK